MQNRLIWNTLLSYTRKGNFLPVDAFVAEDFSGSDTKELFEQNLISQPANWEYRTKPVKYTFNKHYYRTKEFNNLDWSNSIVVLGCSNVFGVGVDDGDTVCSVLEKITGIPVINLGVGGSSINFSLHNSVILSKYFPTPLAVVQLWTEESRCVFYTKRKVLSYGVWNNTENSYADKWTADEYNYKTNAMFASMMSRQLWDGKCKYYEASYFPDTAKTIKCDLLTNRDWARDFYHFGPKTSLLTAEKIAKNLNI